MRVRVIEWTITDRTRDSSACTLRASSRQHARELFAVECGYSSLAAYHAHRGTTDADLVLERTDL